MNLAAALAEARRKVLLIDLHGQFGDATLYVSDQKPAMTLSDICAQIGMDAQTASRLAKIWLGRKDGNQDDIMTAERLATTESALERALAELRQARETIAVQDRTIEAVQRMGGQQQGVSPMGIATGQPRTGIDGILMVETDDYRNTAEPTVDIFAAPHVVSDASDMTNPLDDGL